MLLPPHQKASYVANSSVLGRIWFFVVAVAFVCLMVMGGTSAPSPWARLGLSLGSLGIIAGAAWILRRGLPGRLASTAVFIVCLTGLVFALQLLPFPAGWQGFLAGREPFIAANRIAGVDASTLAISLSPAMTTSAMLALLPGVAMFAAGLSLEPRYRIGIAALFTVFAILSALLGIAQRFAGSEALYLYDYTGIGIGSGLFGNRNFFAALLYVSIPMLAVLAFTAVKNQLIPGWLVTLLGLAYLTVIVGGLAAAASRAGIILGMATIIATAFLPWGALNSIRTRISRRTLLYASMVFLFVFSQFGLVGVLRLIESDPLADYRSVIRQVSWRALTEFFPVGSGFGTFVPVYQMFETPAEMLASYVNHAHNDWLEILVEGGLPALILLLIGVVWFVVAATRIWVRRSDSGGDLVMTASTIGAAGLMMHSVVDYPLRTPALMGFFGLCLGFMAASFVVKQSRVHTHRQGINKPQVVPSAARRPFTPFKPRESEPTSGPVDAP